MKTRLTTRGASSLDDAIAYAIEAENDEKTNIPSSELFCRRCNKSGHRQRDCLTSNNNRSEVNQLISVLRSISNGQGRQSNDFRGNFNITRNMNNNRNRNWNNNNPFNRNWNNMANRNWTSNFMPNHNWNAPNRNWNWNQNLNNNRFNNNGNNFENMPPLEQQNVGQNNNNNNKPQINNQNRQGPNQNNFGQRRQNDRQRQNYMNMFRDTETLPSSSMESTVSEN